MHTALRASTDASSIGSFLRVVFLVLGVSVLIPGGSVAQQENRASKQATKLVLVDGSELIGTIVSEDSLAIVFMTAGGVTATIPRNQLQRVEQLAGELFGRKYVRPDPNHTRLFFAPTARALKAGQGYFSAYQIFFPFVALGIADVITIGGGISMFPGAESQLVYIAPKLTPVQLENFSLAGGVLHMSSTRGGSGVGIIYAVGTFGSETAALTTGLGWGYLGGETADKPILMLGGELRLSNSVKLMTENWIPPESKTAIIGFGIRFFGENLAADLGFIHRTESKISGFPFFPWLGFAYNFGNSR